MSIEKHNADCEQTIGSIKQMAGTPATVNPLSDIVPTPPPPVGSLEAEIAQLHSMGLHNLAEMLSKATATHKEEHVTTTTTIEKGHK